MSDNLVNGSNHTHDYVGKHRSDRVFSKLEPGRPFQSPRHDFRNAKGHPRVVFGSITQRFNSTFDRDVQVPTGEFPTVEDWSRAAR